MGLILVDFQVMTNVSLPKVGNQVFHGGCCASTRYLGPTQRVDDATNSIHHRGPHQWGGSKSEANKTF